MVTHHPKAAPARPSQVGSHSTRTPLPAGNWGRRTSRWRKGVESASNLLRDFVLRTASHNVLSLKQPEAIELVISYMRRLRLAVCCMQETWLPGFFTKDNTGHIIINNNKDGVHRRGVGIVLATAQPQRAPHRRGLQRLVPRRGRRRRRRRLSFRLQRRRRQPELRVQPARGLGPVNQQQQQQQQQHDDDDEDEAAALQRRRRARSVGFTSLSSADLYAR